MNKKIRRLKEQIERRGGQIFIDDKLPDDITELFLREVLTCPDCMAEARSTSTNATGEKRRRSSGH